MKKGWIFGVGVILGVFAIIGALYLSSISVSTVMAQAGPGSDEDPTFRDPSASQAAPGTEKAPLAAGTAKVYFAPQDNDGNATVLTLYNTSDVDKTVTINATQTSGGIATWLVTIPAQSMRRVVSDAVAAGTTPSWMAPYVFVANFTDFSIIAEMDLPAGIKADGYVVFNLATGTVDPRADQGAIPLRFSADPATVFLPSVQN